MKIIVCFLAVVGLAACVPSKNPVAPRFTTSDVENVIKHIQQQLPCGFPNIGIPPLAPLTIKHQAVSLEMEDLILNVQVDNFSLNNLNSFEIAELKADENQVSFGFVFKNVNGDTDYGLKVFLEKLGFTIDLTGEGHANIEVKEFEIKGSIEYTYEPTSDKLHLKSAKIRVHVGDIKSNILGLSGNGSLAENLNEIIETLVPLVINENEEVISDTIESVVLKIGNFVLNQWKLGELLGSIGIAEGEQSECKPLNQLLIN